MTYSSVVTSKGTITLPASIRKKLGITEGKKVEIQLHGETITVRPQGGWEELDAFGETLRTSLKKRGVAYNNVAALRKQADDIKAAELSEKYFGAK